MSLNQDEHSAIALKDICSAWLGSSVNAQSIMVEMARWNVIVEIIPGVSRSFSPKHALNVSRASSDFFSNCPMS